MLANASLGPGSPIWSPDSRRVAFLGGHRTIFGAPRAYVVSIRGGTVKPLFAPLCGADSISGLSWSRGGGLAFASTVNDAQIYRATTDGSDVRPLATSCAEERAPAWSPDGRSIAYERDKELYVMRENGSGKRRLAGGGAPTWSPDGSTIAFARPGSLGRLYSIAATGGPERPLTADARSAAPDWSAAVDRIAFARFENQLWQVYTMRPDGSDVRRVTRLGGDDPSWSPGGDRIAYVYASNVWTIAPDGTDPKKLTAYDECTEISEPAWSRDGKTIAFTIYSNDSDLGGIAFVPVSGGPVRWPPAPPFTADSYDGGIHASSPAWSPGSPAARFAFRATVDRAADGLHQDRRLGDRVAPAAVDHDAGDHDDEDEDEAEGDERDRRLLPERDDLEHRRLARAGDDDAVVPSRDLRHLHLERARRADASERDGSAGRLQRLERDGPGRACDDDRLPHRGPSRIDRDRNGGCHRTCPEQRDEEREQGGRFHDYERGYPLPKATKGESHASVHP